MDLKGTTNLDPKLKETYERVMGTSFTPAPADPATPQPQPQLKTEPVSDQPAATIPNIDAPLQPPPVQPLTQAMPPLPPIAEAPQPAQPLPPTPAASAQSGPEMVQSPQIFSSVNPFQETVAPPGEVLANNAVVPEKKTNKFVMIGVVVGGAVFFVVYAFIWAKVFGLF